MLQSPNTLRQWLEENKDRELIIRKEEDAAEQNHYPLQDVDMVQHNDTDDYLSEQALLLRVPARCVQGLPGTSAVRCL